MVNQAQKLKHGELLTAIGYVDFLRDIYWNTTSSDVPFPVFPKWNTLKAEFKYCQNRNDCEEHHESVYAPVSNAPISISVERKVNLRLW